MIIVVMIIEDYLQLLNQRILRVVKEMNMDTTS